MSGKFVSAGSLDQNTDRDNEWLQARQELEAKQKERENVKPEHDGKTLFEVLQANKAAKEQAFQESIKLKNQFRALNDDEADFLDSQAEAARAKEQAVRQETSEQLKLFRQKQNTASKSSFTEDKSNEALSDNDTEWTASRKRKRVKQKKSVRGVKVPRSSEELPAPIVAKSLEVPDAKVSVGNKQGVSLVGYGSDEDSD